MELSSQLRFIRILFVLFFILSIPFAFVFSQPDFVYLASSFSKGKLYVATDEIAKTDTSVSGIHRNQLHLDFAHYEDKFFLAWGPFPAILFLPLAWISSWLDISLLQSIALIAGNIGVFIFLRRIARRFELSEPDSLWCAFAFMFASAYAGVAFFNLGSYFGHVVTCLLMLAALDEYFGKRRLWLVGLYMGCAAATRITAGIGMLFFIFDLGWTPLVLHIHARVVARIVRKYLQLLAPFVVIILSLLMYNAARFHSPFEMGYSYQKLVKGYLFEDREAGLMAFSHLPVNSYRFLFGMPQLNRDPRGIVQFPYLITNGAGMSVFITSSYLLCLFFLRKYDRTNLLAVSTAAATMLFLLFLFSSGKHQFGYRFLLDAAPLIYVVILRALASKQLSLSRSVKVWIAAQALFNIYFVVFGTFSIFAPLYQH